jgi:altered-inheritance-of-mitochondria protein 5
LSSPTGAYDRRLAPREPLPSAEPSQPSQEDLLKHRWNKEVERLAHKAYESRWEDVRNTAVDGWKAAKRLVKGE